MQCTLPIKCETRVMSHWAQGDTPSQAGQGRVCLASGRGGGAVHAATVADAPAFGSASCRRLPAGDGWVLLIPCTPAHRAWRLQYCESWHSARTPGALQAPGGDDPDQDRAAVTWVDGTAGRSGACTVRWNACRPDHLSEPSLPDTSSKLDCFVVAPKACRFGRCHQPPTCGSWCSPSWQSLAS